MAEGDTSGRNTETTGGATNEEILLAMREYQQQKRVCDEENGRLRALIKRWNSAGVPIKPMLETVKLARLDKDEAVGFLRSLFRMSTLRQIIPADGGDLFAGIDVHVSERAKVEETEWAAEESGYRAGKNAVPIDDCPYPHGGPFAVIWTKWWHNGQRANAAALGANATAAAAGRGRPANRKRAAQEPLIPRDAKAERAKRKAGGKRGGTVVPMRGRKRPATNGTTAAV